MKKQFLYIMVNAMIMLNLVGITGIAMEKEEHKHNQKEQEVEVAIKSVTVDGQEQKDMMFSITLSKNPSFDTYESSNLTINQLTYEGRFLNRYEKSRPTGQDFFVHIQGWKNNDNKERDIGRWECQETRSEWIKLQFPNWPHSKKFDIKVFADLTKKTNEHGASIAICHVFIEPRK